MGYDGIVVSTRMWDAVYGDVIRSCTESTNRIVACESIYLCFILIEAVSAR